MAICRHLAKKLIYSRKLSQDNYTCTFNETLFSDGENSSSVKTYKLTESLCFVCFPDIREVRWEMVEAHFYLDQRRLDHQFPHILLPTVPICPLGTCVRLMAPVNSLSMPTLFTIWLSLLHHEWSLFPHPLLWPMECGQFQAEASRSFAHFQSCSWNTTTNMGTSPV